MSDVLLQVYDLSGGLARSMSMMFIGKQIDGIWHTSIVVFGKEYYFGGGICADTPLTTPYGTPVQRLPMGTTTRSQSEFLKFLRCVSPRFTAQSYHLINHNCNNFTDECMRFLLNKPIPSHITGLPNELLSTPLGQQFAPMISSMMNMKNDMFGETENVDHFADFASHEIYFEGRVKIESYPQYDNFVSNSGLIVFWDPRNDESVGLAEVVAGVKCKVAFCDVLRVYYLAPPTVPCFRLVSHGEVIMDYDLEGVLNSVNDINEIVPGV